jgi:hypothetical protein
MRDKYVKRDIKLKHKSMNIITYMVRHNVHVAPIGTLQIGYPTYRLQDITRSNTCIHTLPRGLQLWILPPC